METRIITQVKVWKLILNPMTGRAEEAIMAAWAYDREQLIDWYNSQKTEPYQDGNWYKNFAKESLLEWYNPLYNTEEMGTFGHGVDFEWVNEDVLKTPQILAKKVG